MFSLSAAIINSIQGALPSGHLSRFLGSLMSHEMSQISFRQYGRCQRPAFLHLKGPNKVVFLRHLSLLAACHSFAFMASHTAGRDNSIADALSCFDFQRFLSSSSTRSTCGYLFPTVSAVPASCELTAKCQFYLSNGLAPLTWCVYGSAQCQFLAFCSQDTPRNLCHILLPLLPASKQTLMHFYAHLADGLHHSSIKVYLSVVCSLHIDYGFPDPLTDCPLLQRLLKRD